MYDPKSEAKEFIADSRAEALSQACTYFGCEEGDLTIKEMTASGLAGRELIVAQRTDTVGKVPSGGGGRDRDRGDRGDRGGSRERGERGGRDRDRGERGGRDRGDRGGRGGRGRDRDRSAPRDRDGEGAREPMAAADPVASTGTAEGELGELGEYVFGIIERMNLGDFTVKAQAEGDVHAFEISGDAAQGLTAGDGRASEAIQLLANQAAGRIHEDPPRVIVDVEGDREKRETFLARVADRAAKRAAETGRTVALDAMNGKDRRDIHVALRDTDGIATMSIGEGRYRQVLIVPEGAAEYEDAVSAAEASANAE